MADQQDNNNNANNGSSSWVVWQRLILSELERHDQDSKDIEQKVSDLDKDISEKINKIAIDIAVLQTRAALWGAGAGALLAGIVELGVYLILGHKG